MATWLLSLLVINPARLVAQTPTTPDPRTPDEVTEAIYSKVAEAEEHFYHSRTAAAMDAYSAAVAIDPTHPAAAHALAQRCWARVQQIELDAAETDCLAARALDPSLAAPQIYLVRVYNWRAQTQVALSAAQEARALAPDDPLLLSLLGEAYFDSGNISEAESYLRRAADIRLSAPIHSTVFRNLALLFQRDDNSIAYVNSMARAIALAPNFAPLRDELAVYYVQRSDYTGLIEQLTALVGIYTAAGDKVEQRRHLHLLADYKMQLGDNAGALAAYAAEYTLDLELGLTLAAGQALSRVGMLHLRLGRPTDAEAALLEAIPLVEESPPDHAFVMLNLGRLARNQGSLTTAVAHFTAALDILGDQPDPITAIAIYNELGATSLDLGDSSAAEQHHLAALEAARQANYPQGIAVSLTFLAVLHTLRGSYALAETSLLEALELTQQTGVPLETARVQVGLGRVYRLLGRFTEAAVMLTAAVTALRPVGDAELLAGALSESAQVAIAVSRFDDAASAIEEALALYASLGDLSGQASVLAHLGIIHYHRAAYPEAEAVYQRALVLARQRQLFTLESSLLNNLGAVAERLGDFAVAIDYFEQALAIARQSQAQSTETSALSNMATAFLRMGRFQEALTTHLEALEVAETVGDPIVLATILSNIALVYSEIGDFARADEHFSRALALAEATGDVAGTANILVGVANLAWLTGDADRALESYGRTLAVHRELGLRGGELVILNNMGVIQLDRDDPVAARESFAAALHLAQLTGDRVQEAVLLQNLAGVDLFAGAFEAALAGASASLALAEEIGDTTGVATAHLVRGWAFEAQGDNRAAIEEYIAGIAVREQQLNSLTVDTLKSTFAGNQLDAYVRLVLLLLAEGRTNDAFDYMERARARVLLDQLAGGQADFRAGLDGTLLAAEATLRQSISGRRAQLLQLRSRPRSEWDVAAIQAAQTSLQALEEEYGNLITQLKLQSPAATQLVAVDVAGVTEIQALLPAGSTLVEYFVTPAQVLAFVVSPAGTVAVPLAVTQADLAAAVEEFRAFTTLDDPHPPGLRLLHDWLIAPLAPYLSTEAVIIVPHGVLHYLPFAALTDGERYLGDRVVLSTLPSATVLRYLTPHPLDTSLPEVLALGNPEIDGAMAELPYAGAEAEVVAELFAAQGLVGDAATESALRAQAAGAGVIHIAAHGELNPANPLFSTLYLATDGANDGRLEVHEIYGLDLHAETDLVVLSACQTSVGALSAGDEVVGLTRAFLFAGASAVVASLWNVDDAATAELMQSFYLHLRAGAGKAVALAAAQREIRARYPHPYYWSAFVLTGDAGPLLSPSLAATHDVADNAGRTASQSVAQDADAVTTTSSGATRGGAVTPLNANPNPALPARSPTFWIGVFVSLLLVAGLVVGYRYLRR